jgi:hypothetical protein
MSKANSHSGEGVRGAESVAHGKKSGRGGSKIVTHPEFEPVVVLFFSEFGVSSSHDKKRLQAELQVGNAGIQ